MSLHSCQGFADKPQPNLRNLAVSALTTNFCNWHWTGTKKKSDASTSEISVGPGRSRQTVFLHTRASTPQGIHQLKTTAYLVKST